MHSLPPLEFKSVKPRTFLLALLLPIILLSWPISYFHRHGFHITLAHKYGLWCEHGFVEFRYGTHTEIAWDKDFQPLLCFVPYNQPWEPPPGRTARPLNRLIRWDRFSPPIGLSLKRPFQSAECLAGGEYPYYASDHSIQYQEFGDRFTLWATPHWFLAVLFSLPLSFIAFHHHRTLPARRIAKGLCPTCAYDLRVQLATLSTQDSTLSTPNCPECGTPIPSTPSMPRAS